MNDIRTDHSIWISWILIGLSLFGLLASDYVTTEERGRSEDDPAVIVMVDLYGKLIVALSAAAGKGATELLEQLESYAVYPKVARRLAALHVFLKPKEMDARVEAVRLVYSIESNRVDLILDIAVTIVMQTLLIGTSKFARSS